MTGTVGTTSNESDELLSGDGNDWVRDIITEEDMALVVIVVAVVVVIVVLVLLLES